MKRLNEYRMKMILFGFVAAIVVSSRTVKADFTFGEPTNLGPTVNSSSGDPVDCISADGLELYFDSRRSGGYGGWDIWVTKRETTYDLWGTPHNLGSTINTTGNDGIAYITKDGLELYFNSTRSGGYGNHDIFVSRRANKNDTWGTPENLGPLVNTSGMDCSPCLSATGLELYFYSRNRVGGYGGDDIWVTKRSSVNDPWEMPVNLGPVINTSASEACPCLSSDGLTLWFSEDYGQQQRSGGFGNADIWVAKREAVDHPWNTPVNLGSMINGDFLDASPRITSDGTVLYFCSERPGGYGGVFGDIYEALIIPIVDLNGDLKVDLEDMHIMVDHWGQNNPLCDIGPMPWGDGVVDIQDMIVLAKHLYRITAHWKLDEADGNIAHDSFGDNDGTIYGNPLWQPTGGMKSGSLFLDGIDDYIDIPFILDPSKGPFSVFAWIYCWMPGQVIISQQGESGGTWLGIDSSGNLMTELVPPRVGWVNPRPLVSESAITDVQWHHVGLVWDGSYRALYVDGIEVAKDTAAQNPLKSADGSLYIGASKDLTAGTLFSGFIDDVRLYKQALTAKEIAALAQ